MDVTTKGNVMEEKCTGLKIMPDFCSTGIWCLKRGINLEQNDLKEFGFDVPDWLMQKAENWIELYDNAHCKEDNEDYYKITNEATYLRLKGIGYEIASDFKKILPDADIEFWMESWRGPEVESYRVINNSGKYEFKIYERGK